MTNDQFSSLYLFRFPKFRATLEQMRNAAATTDTRNGGRSTNLVNNAQPISFTGPPPYDSNV